MIIVMKREANEKQIEAVIARILELGFDVHRSSGEERTVLGVVGGGAKDPAQFESMPGVQEVFRISGSS